MRFLMFEKISSGYIELVDGSKHWENEFGEIHKKYGPASIGADGILSWFQEGRFIKSINIEDDDVQIDQILYEFDFNKIHIVMTHIDWSWSIGATYEVPSVKKLRDEAKRLLNSSKKYRYMDEPVIVSCGGFEASAYKGGFCLKFVLEQWNTDE